MFLLTVVVKHTITGDVRSKSWQFDPSTLDAAKMQKLRDIVVLWCQEMEARVIDFPDAEIL